VELSGRFATIARPLTSAVWTRARTSDPETAHRTECGGVICCGTRDGCVASLDVETGRWHMLVAHRDNVVAVAAIDMTAGHPVVRSAGPGAPRVVSLSEEGYICMNGNP
jgi:hypothetical protein